MTESIPFLIQGSPLFVAYSGILEPWNNLGITYSYGISVMLFFTQVARNIQESIGILFSYGFFVGRGLWAAG